MGFELEGRNDRGGARAILTATALVGFLLPLCIMLMFQGPKGMQDASVGLLIGIPTGISLGCLLVVACLFWFKKMGALVVLGGTTITALLGLFLSIGLIDLIDLGPSAPFVVVASTTVFGVLGAWVGVARVREKKFNVPDLPVM